MEKRKGSQSAIVGNIVENTQAKAAGLQRGDVLCFAGSNGQEEIPYAMFLELAKSTQRPLCFEARRVVVSSTTTVASKNADEMARRQAVIAAAEQREKEHKKKQKPIKLETKSTKLRSTAEQARIEEERKQRIEYDKNKPLSEATKQAQELAKQSEQKTAQEFGYNPYESKSMNAGQARNAVSTSTHGSIQQQDSITDDSVAPKRVKAPADPAIPLLPVPDSVQLCFEAIVTSSLDSKTIVSSLSVMKTLIGNATTKGQAAENGSKFRKVRLSNAKIQAALTNVPGAVDLMLESGFSLTTEEEESILLYPVKDTPEWIPTLLHRMQQYVHNSK